ncbi:GNAT family N-acetyltransferase [Frigidibacter mobilis]|uniref:GCN5-related N-acetyltransferase n=1 Tax=Frigidibacter mobilis TaxID=1335048 RepID=A0A159Z6Q7_9RHOB|nr:GNAT family N-acetyltransferase [Frigidibacter mobilis]AMY70198.1 GCN5-related N-acetyltransferase [Frigidibacter mobilis]
MQQARLRTERLLFRKPGASDLAPYTAYCQSDRTRFVGGPFDGIQAFEKLAAMIGHWDLRGFGRLVIVHRTTGRALGHVGALHLNTDEVPELTWTLWAGEDEGKGYATEACRAYRDHARTELGFSFMIARIVQDNLPSRRLAERLGGILNETASPPGWMANAVTYDFEM